MTTLIQACTLRHPPTPAAECLEAVWSQGRSCRECPEDCYRRGWSARQTTQDNARLVRATQQGETDPVLAEESEQNARQEA